MVQWYMTSQMRAAGTTSQNYQHPCKRLFSSTTEARSQIVWPFDGTKWKDFQVKLMSVETQGFLNVQRRVNGVLVGIELQFDSGDAQFLEKTDTVEVTVVKGDLLGIRFRTTISSGSDPTFHTNSYLEFADGLFGF